MESEWPCLDAGKNGFCQSNAKALFKLDFARESRQILCVNPMKSRRQIVLFALIGLVDLMVVVASLAMRPREPVYQGNSLGEWIDKLDVGTDEQIQAAQEAVPALFRLLDDPQAGISASNALKQIDAEAAAKAGVK